jgi:solute:Na+ symporter, SSS family
MIAAISWIDWLVLALSVLVVAFAGAWFARRQKSTERYFVGARSIPGWAAGLSLFASSISTITFVAYPGNGFGGDWTRLLPGLMLPIVILFVSLAILPFYRRFLHMSVYEYLEQRFGYPARAYAAILYLLVNLFRFSFVLFLTALAIHTMTGWDIKRIILISGVITIIYTVLGGFEAVVWTDVMQSFILLAGGLLCVILLLLASEGGPGQAIRTAWDAGKFHIADLSLDPTRPTILVMVCYGLFSSAGGYITTQDAVQRYLAPPTLRQARRGLWLGTISCVATWTLFTFIGTLLYSYYTAHMDQLPAHIWKEQDKVLPHFVMTRFPPGAIGLVLAAMVAASMSTLSAVINSMSMVTICDLHNRIRPTSSDHRQLILGKATTCLWGVIGTLTALSMIRVKTALDFSYTISSILSGGLLGVFMLAFLVRRAHTIGIYIALAAGILMTAWGSLGELGNAGLPLPEFLRKIPFPFHTYLLVACSNLASFAVGYVACLLVPDHAKREGPALTLWDLRSPKPHSDDLAGGDGHRDTSS